VNKTRLKNRGDTRLVEDEARNNSCPSQTKNFEERAAILENLEGLRITKFAETLLVDEILATPNLNVLELPAMKEAGRMFQVKYTTPLTKPNGVLWYPSRPPWVVELVETDEKRLLCTCPFHSRYLLPCRHLLKVTGGVFGLSDVHHRYLLDYSLGHLDPGKLSPPTPGLVLPAGTLLLPHLTLTF
jgi:hypothetical protein